MKKNKSELTFKEFVENLGYIKVIWNGKVVYDISNRVLTIYNAGVKKIYLKSCIVNRNY